MKYITQLTKLYCGFILSVIIFQLSIFTIQAQSQENEASLSFSPEVVNTKSGDTFTTELSIDTAGAAVGGVGAKILYNPEIVQVEKIETQQLFPDYPASTFDNTTGNMTISGIVNGTDQLYSGKGVFAKVTWKAVTGGTDTIQFSFKPNDTKDSNIAVLYGNGDILQKVNSVQVTVEGNLQPNAAALNIDSNVSIAPTTTPEAKLHTIGPAPYPKIPFFTITSQKVLALLLVASFTLHFIFFKKINHLEDQLLQNAKLTEQPENIFKR